jgi:GxxExxY protein
MPIYYENTEIGTRRVEEKVIVKLKAVTSLDKVHLAQALNYLEALKLEIGLLINFGNSRLEFKRLIKSLINNINDIS